ncbi:MAG: ParB/Srx family N-terminal domain-containing protein [Thermoguttaceae bacterium]|jgi:ParB/RepB/Spo0J family partition protein
METERIDLEVCRLKPSGGSLRRRQRRSIDEIAKSIHEFGFLQPIVVDAHYAVIIGNGRLEAAKQLGYATVPVVIVKGLTEDQRRRLQIADNRLAELSRWDRSGLTEQMERLSEPQPPEIPGLSHEEVCDLLGLTEMSKAKCEFPPEIEKTATHAGTHLLASCRTGDINKMAKLVAALSSESWCTLEQASR